MRKNAYYCEACRGYVVTVDVDEGVTPMFLVCRVKGDPSHPANTCKGRMRSLMYPKEPWPETDGWGQPIPTEPTWEWFKPTSDELTELDPEMRDHIDRGGLDLRQIGTPAPPRPSRAVRRANAKANRRGHRRRTR